jgi:hypothetical protein
VQARAEAPPVDGKEAYEQRYIGFDDFVLANGFGATLVNSWYGPYEGKYRRRLSYDQFYARVGAGTNLVHRHRVLRGTWIGLVVGGSLAMVGGIIALAVQAVANSDAYLRCTQVSNDLCDHESGKTGYIAGGILLPVGFGAFLGGLILSSRQTVKRAEAHELVDRYNSNLRHELGLDVEPVRPPASPPSGVTFSQLSFRF